MFQQLTGQVIDGRYRITGYQRAGRVGDSYLARRLEDNQLFSVKVLDPTTMNHPEIRRRFLREAEVMSRFSHPNVLEVVEYGATPDGIPWILCEHVEGETLAERIEEGPLDPEDAVAITAQVLLALESAHAMGIIHRDLAPENILLEQTDTGVQARVLDFGLAALMDGEEGEGAQITAVGVRVGSPFYMSPEYVRDYALDHRADLYSLGIVLHEMVTGVPPFVGRAYEILELHLIGTAPPLPMGVPEWLSAFRDRLLAKEPLDRPQTSTEAVLELEAVSGRRWSGDLGLTPVETQEPESNQQSPSPRPRRRSDPLLDKFIDAHILDVRTIPSGEPIPREDANVVIYVVPQSPAHRVGIEPGMLLRFDPPRKALIPLDTERTTPTTLVAYHPKKTFRLEVTYTGIPLGLRMRHTSQQVHRRFDAERDDLLPLIDLWNHNDMEGLAHHVKPLVTHRTGQRLAPSLGPTPRNSPATVLWAAVCCARGEFDEANRFLTAWEREYRSGWSDEYDAMARTVRAELGLQKAESSNIIKRALSQAWLTEPLPRTQRLLKQHDLRPARPELLGQRFPEYTLRKHGQTTSLSLTQTLEALDPAEVLIICCLGGFQSAPRYRRFLNYAQRCLPHMSQIAGGHVLTTVETPEGPEVPEGFEILVDEDGLVHRNIPRVVTPSVLVVSQTGIVVHQGLMDECGLWTALAWAGQLRMANNPS